MSVVCLFVFTIYDHKKYENHEHPPIANRERNTKGATGFEFCLKSFKLQNRFFLTDLIIITSNFPLIFNPLLGLNIVKHRKSGTR